MREKQFLLATLLLILLFGASSFYSMMEEPAAAIQSDSRSPASEKGSQARVVEPEPSHRNLIKAKSVTMDINCHQNSPIEQTFEVDGSLLRIRGKSCLNEGWKDVSIVNESNGYTAAVIFVKQGFTTDFMDMTEGTNKLAIRGINEKGQPVERLLLINKRAPASL